MEQITENVYAEAGYSGCNPGFVVTSEGVVMIDSPQMPTDAMAYREEITKYGEIKYLINTEPHGDHWIGNGFFETICIAHEGTRDGIKSISIEEVKARIELSDPSFTPHMDSFRVLIPSITFTERMKLYVGEHEFELINMPGHTPSETAVLIPQERVIFTGDNIFYKCQTFFKEGHPHDWLDSLEKLKQIDVDYIVPGHGEVCTKDYIDEQAAFIKDWIAAAKNAVEKGWTLEEALERISFLDRYPMLPGMEGFTKELQKMNVNRLYTLAKEGGL